MHLSYTKDHKITFFCTENSFSKKENSFGKDHSKNFCDCAFRLIHWSFSEENKKTWSIHIVFLKWFYNMGPIIFLVIFFLKYNCLKEREFAKHENFPFPESLDKYRWRRPVCTPLFLLNSSFQRLFWFIERIIWKIYYFSPYLKYRRKIIHSLGSNFFFFQCKTANSFYSKINDSSRVRTTAFSSSRFRVRVSVVPNIFTIYP